MRTHETNYLVAAVKPSMAVIRGSRGPRASCNRTRMYAGPVAWVSNYENFACRSGGIYITSGIIIIIFGCLCKSNCGPFRGLEWFSPVPGALPDVTEAVPTQGDVNTKSSTGFLERARRTVFGLQVRARMRSAPCRSPVVIHAPTFCVCASRPVAATGRGGGVVGRPRPCHSLARSHVCS
jgi:hypothetical protein